MRPTRLVRRFAPWLCIAMITSSCAAIGLAPACGDGLEIIGEFEQVGDLVENSNVQSSDVVIGNVQTIELDGWNAEVTMCLQEGEEVPADVKAVVRTTSLLGEKFVDLQVGSQEPPFLEDGDILGLDQTGKATELEEVFAKLASILGTGNLEQLNRFTHAQARILENRAGSLREVLDRLHRFTELLAGREDQIYDSVDSLNSVAGTVIDDSAVLQRFLASFADSARVLNRQKDGLETLLLSLDRFTNISLQLLESTENGLDSQLRDLRPILRTAVENSANVRETLTTLATFSEWFPESMPGDYLQLDVCQAPPETFGPGDTCPQSDQNDDESRSQDTASPDGSDETSGRSPVDFLLNLPLSRASS